MEATFIKLTHSSMLYQFSLRKENHPEGITSTRGIYDRI
jgi:hypothetical protein